MDERQEKILIDCWAELSNIFTDIHDIRDYMGEIVHHLRFMNDCCNGRYSSGSALCNMCPYINQCIRDEENS